MDERGLAASTVDRRLSTVCGYYRFAHIDGRIGANPAQYVRRPRVHPATQRGMDRGELAAFLYTAERTSPGHAALAVLLGLNGLRVSEACGTNIEDLGFERGHRTLHIVGKGNQPATVPLVPRTARTLDLAIGERTVGPILRRCRRRPPRRPHRLPLGALDRHPGRARPRPPAHAARGVHHGRPRCRRPAARRPTCRPPRRPEDDHRVRPSPPGLRPSRRLRRRRLRHQRMTTTDRPTAETGCHRTPCCRHSVSPCGQPGRRPSTSAQADNHRPHPVQASVRRVRAPATTRNEPDVLVTARRTVGGHEDLPTDGHESLPTGGHVMAPLIVRSDGRGAQGRAAHGTSRMRWPGRRPIIPACLSDGLGADCAGGARVGFD